MCKPNERPEHGPATDANTQQPTYTIYLLTVWYDKAGNITKPQAWRFRLENPKTQERQGFVGIKALMAGLVKIVSERVELEELGNTDD